jgi:hypothetical protein
MKYHSLSIRPEFGKLPETGRRKAIPRANRRDSRDTGSVGRSLGPKRSHDHSVVTRLFLSYS